MAFNRKISLIVGQGGFGKELKELDIDFNITKSVTPSPNNANFTIYNLTENTEKQYLKNGNTLIFKAGYDDEGIGTIFSGKVISTRTFRLGPDRITEIIATDMGNSTAKFQRTKVNVSYVVDTPLTSVINDLSILVGNLAIGGKEVISGITLKDGLTYFGTISGLFRKIQLTLAKNDIGFFFRNSELIFWLFDAPTPFTTILLSPESGLIGRVENLTENDSKNPNKKRVQFTSIINPDYTLLALINLIETNEDGAYFAQKLEYNGNNYGGDFQVVIEAAQ